MKHGSGQQLWSLVGWLAEKKKKNKQKRKEEAVVTTQQQHRWGEQWSLRPSSVRERERKMALVSELKVIEWERAGDRQVYVLVSDL